MSATLCMNHLNMTASLINNTGLNDAQKLHIVLTQQSADDVVTQVSRSGGGT